METKDNIYLFKLNESVIKPIVEKKVKKGDLLGALSLLRSSLRHEFSLEVVGDIAELYSEMEQYELSNKWWFYYLSQAPKEKKGRAFEELALNFYCLENEVLITHYLVEKYNLDGNISNDVLTSGIDELLKESAQQPKFRLLHPVELADYSYELKKAKSYMSLGCYTKAIDLLESIPKGCKQYLPSLEEKWLAYYLKGETKKSVAIIKEVIAEKGESLLTCCHLSGMYKTLNQEEKSLYYYEKAKQMPSTDAEDVYRLAYVAF